MQVGHSLNSLYQLTAVDDETVRFPVFIWKTDVYRNHFQGLNLA